MYLRNELINLRSTLLKILAFTDHFSSPKGQFITNSAPVFARAFTQNRFESINYNYYTP